jgi:hypothetical protein
MRRTWSEVRPGLHRVVGRVGRFIGRWFGAAVGVLVVVAFITSMAVPKNHLAVPLGDGCYYLGMDRDIFQWQHCDEWRKAER